MKINAIRKTYEGRTVLDFDGVSLEKGKIYAVLGANGSKKYVSTWALIQCKDGASRWYFFDERGIMLTGWVWIKGADGLSRCYYLDKSNSDLKGALYMNGRTPDEYYVTSSGEWFAAGKIQTR